MVWRRLDGPNTDNDRIIHAVHENQWRVSHKFRKAFPIVESAGIGGAIGDGIRTAVDDPDIGQDV